MRITLPTPPFSFAPHLGHVLADLLTSVPQSLHVFIMVSFRESDSLNFEREREECQLLAFKSAILLMARKFVAVAEIKSDSFDMLKPFRLLFRKGRYGSTRFALVKESPDSPFH